MTATATTASEIPTTPKPLRIAPILRTQAQGATGLSAGFDKILQSQLDSVEPIDRPQESETQAERPTQESDLPEHDEGATADQGEKTHSGSQADSNPDAQAQSDTEPEKRDGDPESEQDAADSQRQETQGIEQQPTPIIEQPAKREAETDDEAKRLFIAQHGKRAAKLRWDSAGVELTHAAEVDIAEQNAQKLITRAAQPVRSPLHPNEAAEPKNNKLHAAGVSNNALNKGQREIRAESVQPESVQAQPAFVPDSAENQAGNLGLPMSNGLQRSPQAHSVVVHENRRGQNQNQSSSSSTSRSDLVARLGNIASQGQAATVSRGSANAVAGVSRVSLRAERSHKPAMARPSKGTDRSAAMRQVQQGLAKLIKGSGGQTTLRLNPRSLGEVTVRLDIREGVANARFTASSEVARSLLDSGLKELRAALETRGIRVERLAVDSALAKVSAEPAHPGAREDSQVSRASDGSPLSDRPEAESENQSAFSHTPDRHSGHGRRGDHQSRALERSDEALQHESQSLGEPFGLDDGWIRLDTVA